MHWFVILQLFQYTEVFLLAVFHLRSKVNEIGYRKLRGGITLSGLCSTSVWAEEPPLVCGCL